MFIYICLGTNDLLRAAAFYDASGALLGLHGWQMPSEVESEGWAGLSDIPTTVGFAFGSGKGRRRKVASLQSVTAPVAAR